ncbi:hypothetical protein HOV43_gp222 [Escherichia phage vB_EcoM_KWBSE43-6]|uniref:Uncharacterized protein n=1 Tax=Escherichia phage vB_EcoM_KWBSE43-6 TaxID=2508194 RepID=A0A482MXV5_9CAUD|nr:hypothetical protein HOV43_gp222 [Escherichia phage vB_EcoM_KWBSE43-6]QBQ78961.1 hypothetical protein KWBSE43_00136 [Escherichia phage vB_EcoM_KWBSE43-6]
MSQSAFGSANRAIAANVRPQDTDTQESDSHFIQIQSVEATVVRTSRNATPDTLIQTQ